MKGEDRIAVRSGSPLLLCCLLGVALVAGGVVWQSLASQPPSGASKLRDHARDQRSEAPIVPLLDGAGRARPDEASTARHTPGGEEIEEEEVTEEAVIDENEWSTGPVEPTFDDEEERRRWEARKHAEARGTDAYFAHLRSPEGGARRRIDPVMLALWWLRGHQEPDGRFSASAWFKTCDGKPVEHPLSDDARGDARYDIGVTALALCAMLSAGYTNRGQHPFKRTVSKGLRYLKNQQTPEGRFGAQGPRKSLYNHALASLALVKAYELTGSPIFKGAAKRGVAFLLEARTPQGAWGYGRRPLSNNTSITAWATLALHVARGIDQERLRHGKSAAFGVPSAVFDDVRAWLETMTDPRDGVVGYVQRGGPSFRPDGRAARFPENRTAAMTAAGTALRYMLLEAPADDGLVSLGLTRILDHPARPGDRDGGVDYIHYFFGSMACEAAGGRVWTVWRTSLFDSLRGVQHTEEGSFCRLRGSFDPVGVWGKEGGRVATTAFGALCLAYTYRYDRVFRPR